MSESVEKKERKPAIKSVLGWAAVLIVAAAAGIWAYWGGIENFHEGWYSQSIWENIFIMFIQYWLITIAFVVLGLLGLRFQKTTLLLCILLAAAAAWFFRGAHISVMLLIIPPILLVGLLFFFGDPKPKWLARLALAGIPALVLAATTVWGVAMVSARIDDGDYGARIVAGNGVCLVWAPEGPGWPDTGCTFDEAQSICSHLSEDGSELLEEEVNIWRLPTADEAVRSMALHGENAGGVWDEKTQQASYDKMPDKETPLWKKYSHVIYYWTSTPAGTDEAYIIVYNGGVFSRNTGRLYGNYTSFRAVKDFGG